MKGQLKFNMIQNWNEEFPDLKPYEVIKLNKEENKEGYSHCDEYGKSDYLPGLGKKHDYRSFVAADENTVLAFLGESFKENGKIFLKVFQRDLKKSPKVVVCKEA